MNAERRAVVLSASICVHLRFHSFVFIRVNSCRFVFRVLNAGKCSMDQILSNPGLSIAVLVAIAAVFLFAEMLLPTHGVLGGLGLCCLVGVIVLCYRING